MLRKQLLILLSLVLSVCAYTQGITAEQGLQQLEAIIKPISNKKANKSILDYLKTHDQAHFIDEKNYFLFLQDVDSLFNETQPYYPDLLFFVGRKLQLSNRQKEAFPYLYKIQLYITPDRSYDFECEFYEIMGLSYFFFKRYEQSKDMLYKALQCDKTTERAKINIYNTLGLIYSQSQWKRSEEYYRKAIETAQTSGNQAWYGVASGNLGSLYFIKQEYDLAKKYLNIDFSISEESGEVESALSALSTLLEIDILQKKSGDAKIKMHIIDSIDRANRNKPSQVIYNAKALWHEHTHNYPEALRNYKLAQQIRDSINLIRNQINANNTEFQIDFEHRQAKIQVLQEQSRTNKRIMAGLIVLAATITIGAFVSIRQILKRKKKEQELLELKNKQVKENLERAEQELQNILRSLMEKNETISKMNEELETMFVKMTRTDEERKKLTDKLQSFILLTDEDWLQFKHLFEKRYPGFFNYFQSNYEDITNAEIRLAALLKLNLENLEISKALGISPDSVRKTNLRLRKRLDISEQKDLQKLIQSIG